MRLLPVLRGCVVGFHRSAAVSIRSFSSSSSKQRTSIAELDRIHLRGLRFHGYHGVFPEENKLGQKFEVDATLFCDLRAAGASDDLADSVDYAAAYSEVREVMEGPPFRLLEAAAEQLAVRLMRWNACIEGVQVHVRKPHVAVQGVVESLGVEIVRVRSDLPPA